MTESGQILSTDKKIDNIPKKKMDYVVKEVVKIITSGEFNFSDEEINKRLCKTLVSKCNFSENLSEDIILRSRNWILATSLAKKYFPPLYGKKSFGKTIKEVVDLIFRDEPKPQFTHGFATAAILSVKNEVHRQVFKDMETFARLNVVDASNMHERSVKVATTAIKKFNLNYYADFLHKMFSKAIANQQAIVRKKDRKAREAIEAKKKIEIMKAGQEKLRKNQELATRFNAETSVKSALKEKQARQKAVKKEEILARRRVPIWKTNGTRLPDAYPVKNQDEAYKLNNMSLVFLNDVIYNVIKNPKSGKVYLRELDFEVVFSKPVQKVDDTDGDAPAVDIVKFNTIWVVCLDVASEAIKAYSLLKNQVAKEIISKLPDGSFVVRDMVAINNAALYKVQSSKLVKIGPCRKATRKERNTSSEYLRQKCASR